MKRFIIGLIAAGTLLGCADDSPRAVDLLSLRVFQVAYDAADLERDPYKGVAFMRLIATDASGVVTDKFVNHTEGVERTLDDIPFGEDIQITIEGWSRNPQTGQVGQVLSRGRTPRLDLSEDGEQQQINVPFARVNMFSRTSAPGTAGAVATSLTQGRMGHTATRMADGRVLITGGYVPVQGRNRDFTGPDDIQQVLNSAEIYDPRSGSFSPAGGTLASARAFHTAVLLDNQAVLLAGGINGGKEAVATIEAYDPIQDVFIPLGSIPLKTARFGHTATVLDDAGHVLFAGGFSLSGGARSALTSAEVVCLPTFPCETSGSLGVIFEDQMKQARGFHTATRVDLGQNGEVEAVVLAGGEGDDAVRSTVEVFRLANPAGFDPNEVPMEMVGGARTRHTANYIHNQRFIHIVGGFSDLEHTLPVQRIDSFQVQQRAFNEAKEFYSLHARGGHGAVNMPGSSILLFGGWDANGPVNHAEVIFEYQDVDDMKTYIDRGGVGGMIESRAGAQGVLLDNDTVLVVGGVRADGVLNKAGEFFNPL